VQAFTPAVIFMTTFLAAIVIATALIVSIGQIVTQMRAAREDARRARTLSIVQLFGPAVAAVQDDPKALLVWQPLAAAMRKLFPEEYASLDAASGSSFPFSAEVMSAAHAKWTADWLAWEATHDATYKMKAAVAAQDAESAAGRARVDAVEREKLDLYQRRYEEYVRVSKALQKLTG
jgi:hypothetical protein